MTSNHEFRPLVNNQSEPAIASRFDEPPIGDVVADIRAGQELQQIKALIVELGEDAVRRAFGWTVEV